MPWMPLSLIVGAALGPLIWRGAPADPEPAEPARPAPILWFVAVTAALFLNQIAVSAWMSLHGRPAWMGHFPPWFFQPIEGPGVAWLAGAAPHSLLSLSMLRVQAFLELPFAWLGLLSAAWLVDRSAYRGLTRGGVTLAIGLCWSGPLMVLEHQLTSPWTEQDLWIRAASVPAIWLLSLRLRRVPAPGGAALSGLGGLAMGLLTVTLLSLGTVAVCWWCLLYVFADFPPMLPIALPAALALGSLVARSARQGGLVLGRPRVAVQAVVGVGRSFLLLFAAAALPLRYTWGTPLGRGTLAGIAALSVGLGVWPWLRRHPKVLGMGLVCGLALAALPLVSDWQDFAMLQRGALSLAGLGLGGVWAERASDRARG